MPNIPKIILSITLLIIAFAIGNILVANFGDNSRWIIILAVIIFYIVWWNRRRPPSK